LNGVFHIKDSKSANGKNLVTMPEYADHHHHHHHDNHPVASTTESPDYEELCEI
jgi:hypothetical protein